MDRQQLHRELERLHQQLRQTGSEDPKLRKLEADIREILERDHAESGNYGAITEQLKDGIYRFDAEHPQLAKTMAQVIDSLALFNL